MLKPTFAFAVWLAAMLCALSSTVVHAQQPDPTPAIATTDATTLVGNAQKGIATLLVESPTAQGKRYSLTLQALVLMTILTLLPAFLLMTTAFTRIIIVLAILRQALGTAQTPSNQILIGLSLFLTLFIMTPVFEKVHDESVSPYLADQIDAEQALDRAAKPIRAFMLSQTRESDLNLFVDISRGGYTSVEQVPFNVPTASICNQ